MKRFFDLRDLGAAFSLANLWFITIWKQLIYPLNEGFLDFAPPSFFEYLAILLDVLLLTFIFLILINLTNFFRHNWLKGVSQIIFLTLGCFAFGALGSEIIKWFSPKTVNFVNLPLPIIVLLFSFAFVVKQKLRISAAIENLRLIALFFLPFCLLITVQFLWVGFIADHERLMPQSIEEDYSQNGKPNLSQKVVWIIFDEIDYAVLTNADRNNTALPDIERLINQSFTAQNAFPPNDATIRSIPSLLSGKIVRAAVPIATNDLRLEPADHSESYTFRQSSSIFKEVRNLGGENGIVGWYHPYPRIFQGQTAYAFRGGPLPPCASWIGLTDCSARIFVASLLNVPFMARIFPNLWTVNVAFSNDEHDWQRKRHDFLTEKANELISKPELNLLFFHFSVPHEPFIGRDNLQGKETYFDSLEVVNDTLKQLRETLEKSGQWEETVLIVSSDHWWRFKEAKDLNYLPETEKQEVLKDRRVPFIIKFAGQKTRIDYKSPINTVVTKELILSIFKDQIKKPEELAPWLDNLRQVNPDLINSPPEIGRDLENH